MIIQIRGTSGSGKSTVMRTVMNLLGGFPAVLRPVFVEGRKKPLYYSGAGVSVLGHYESPCGGCDTIHGYEALLSLTRERAAAGHVLMEGLLLSEDSKNTLTLPADTLRVIFLNTGLETCLERIRGRRAARGNDKPLNVDNTANRVRTIARARTKLEAAGVDCRTATCDQAPRLIIEWLKSSGTRTGVGQVGASKGL